MADVFATIDATLDGRCACGCGTVLVTDGPSVWFAGPAHQRRFEEAHATDPADVYRRTDAAQVLVGADHVPIPLQEAGATGCADPVWPPEAFDWRAWFAHRAYWCEDDIVTAAPAPRPPEPGEVWTNLQRMFGQILSSMRPRRLECGTRVRESMALITQSPREWSEGTLFGIPIVVDESMPPNRWRVIDRDGNVVLYEGTDGP